MHTQLAAMADAERDAAVSAMPSDAIAKTVLFVEILRVLDCVAVSRSSASPSAWPNLELMTWGLNLATYHLYTAVEMPGAFPLRESTPETRRFAASLLRKWGCSVLLRRAADMVRFGFLDVEENSAGLVVRRSKGAASTIPEQFADILEQTRLTKVKEDIRSGRIHHMWELFDIDDNVTPPTRVGSFVGMDSNPLAKFILPHLDDVMAPLIFPWETTQGTMMGYNALPEVDYHFSAEAMELVLQWRSEAGLHPGVSIGSVTGADITAAIVMMAALHLKHLTFARIASTKHSNISIPQSLTIWGPYDDLIGSISDYAGTEKDAVRCALDAITLFPEDKHALRDLTTPFVPLLVSLGNGLALRPVASIATNPFLTALSLLEWRNPGATDRIVRPREGWMRKDLYALFQGTRYVTVDGSVTLRDGDTEISDIDAAICDTLSGDIALFQLKWQDYFTNDVRKLRSKAANLSRGLDDWTKNVLLWLERHGTSKLRSSLRLKELRHSVNPKVHLFAISRSLARTQGYGFPVSTEKLAVATWAQFTRIRHQVGPVNRVFSRLFETIRMEMNQTVDPEPIPATIHVGGKSIRFHDMWNIIGEDDPNTPK